MRDYSCHTVKSIINAFEKGVNYPFKFKIDTGSQVNIIPLSTFRELNIKHPLLPLETQLSSYTGNPLNVRGTINLNCRYKVNQIETLF